jgi:sec-independent protein translocase protein TatA
MGRLFDNPWTVIILLVVVLLLFGAPKLPGLARSLGQSMRIFKSEVKQMNNEHHSDDAEEADRHSTGQKNPDHGHQPPSINGHPRHSHEQI